MANYHTQYSCLLDCGTQEAATRAIEIFEGKKWHPKGEYEDFDPDLRVMQRHDDPTNIWLSDEYGEGDVEAVIAFVKHLGPQLGLTGRWGFTYACTCDKARLDAFDGGAHVIDLGTGQTLGYVNAREWLELAVSGDNDMQAGEF